MTSELIGCRTCSSPYCKGCNMFTLYKALEAGKFDALMSENHTLHDSDLDNLGWISVEERLPERWEWVLISKGAGTIDLAFRNSEYKWVCEGLVEVSGVTHWFTFPKPPKEET